MVQKSWCFHAAFKNVIFIEEHAFFAFFFFFCFSIDHDVKTNFTYAHWIKHHPICEPTCVRFVGRPSTYIKMKLRRKVLLLEKPMVLTKIQSLTHLRFLF